MKYLDLKEIICKLMILNKAIRAEIKSENYLLFKMFVKEYSLNKRFYRSDMVAHYDVFKLIKQNLILSKLTKPQQI